MSTQDAIDTLLTLYVEEGESEELELNLSIGNLPSENVDLVALIAARNGLRYDLLTAVMRYVPEPILDNQVGKVPNLKTIG